MPGKIPLSVRISQEDAAFLAALDISGATTLSEKLRTLIREARLRHEGCHDYAECFAIQQQAWAPFVQRLRESEATSAMHSELLVQLAHWLADITAFLLADPPAKDGVPSDARLKSLESGAADRTFSLIEMTLRLAVTNRNPCYDESAINRRLSPMLELCDMVQSANPTKMGGPNDD